jgi:TctA family transporter
MKTFGRLLQQGALCILPLAMLMELTDALGRDVGVSDMVVMLVFGVLAFVLGRTLEGVANRRS